MSSLGRVLEINLKSGVIADFPLSEEAGKTWLGGRGLNVALLQRFLPRGTDALSPDNILLMSCGLLTGTAALTSSRLHINALSPLTGFLGSSNVGGYFGAWLRSCGMQGLMIRDRAETPVYLLADESGVRIMDATGLWGLDACDTQAELKLRHGEKSQSLVIGPGGENLARFACIVADMDHAAGRTGMGAVMGSKRLKAVVVTRGSLQPEPVSRDAFKAALDRFVKAITGSEDYRIFSKYGGASYVKWADDHALMGTRNYRQTTFEGIDAIDGMQLTGNVARSRACYRCPVHCKAVLTFKEGRLKGQEAYRPEFEPMINLGAKCGLKDIQTLIYLDNLCTRLGIDSTSAGTSIAFAMDLFERGILTAGDTDGLDLAWGSGDAMEALIRGMASGQGLGGILAQGVRRAAEIIGRGADQYAAHVKGLELTAYHPGSLLGTALGYAISSRGGDYNNVYASLEHRWTPDMCAEAFGTPKAIEPQSPEGKGRLVSRAVRVNVVVDSLGLCKVPVLSMVGTFDLEIEAEISSAVTGWRLGADDLFRAGDRIAAAERLFNLNQGLNQGDDTLPEMFFTDDKSALTRESLRMMIEDFYRAMGWDERGRLSPELEEDLERALALLDRPLNKTEN